MKFPLFMRFFGDTKRSMIKQHKPCSRNLNVFLNSFTGLLPASLHFCLFHRTSFCSGVNLVPRFFQLFTIIFSKVNIFNRLYRSVALTTLKT